MLILVTGNNFLMMFVGWEGVGLCSFLLIGFWFDKTKGVGWRNSLAARKAMIVNRVGDFGLLMGIFLMFWTFGTLDYYRPTEVNNVHLATEEHEAALEGAAEGEHGAEAAPPEGEHVTEAAPAEGEHVTEVAPAGGEHGAEAAPPEGEHGAEAAVAESEPEYFNNDHLETDQLGVFGQAERMLAEDKEVDFGPFSLPIKTVIVLITLFMLLGATGKSAQIPLFIWLPDAMAGPTPVSALIHAATMVTAGVYMMVRSNIFYANAELTSIIVALVGAGTAIVAGYIAIGQWDIKRVLAYSTISQLGFMVAAVGVGAYQAAMFHLVTHAFFKALLFLGSGSVIHGVEHGHHHVSHGHGHDDDHHHEEEFDPQDMRNMGGLKRAMPLTYLTYLIGTLALAGIFPFAGFWSKDEILAGSWLAGMNNNQAVGFIVFGLLLAAAGCTAFYMWRQMEMVFFGEPRTEAANYASESSATMVIPLLILGLLSIFGGFWNTPHNVLGLEYTFGAERLTLFLEHSVASIKVGEFQPGIAILSLGLALGAIMLARSVYGKGKALTADHKDPLAVRGETSAIWSLANARLYWDETYFRLFENPFNILSRFLANTLDWAFWHDYFHNVIIGKGFNAIGELLSKPVDLGIIDGIVNGVGLLARWSAGRLRVVQTGYVRGYAITFMLGVVLVVVILLLPLLQR
jgi:NADH-quinone oxidoreductase subunit L